MDNINYKKTTLSGLMWRFFERIGVQIITLVVSVILARLLGPEAYGDIAVTTIFITICNVFVTSGFGVALVQKKDSDELDFSSVFYSSLVISIVLYVALFFSAPYIADFFGTPIVGPVLQVVGLRLPISALGSVQNAYVNKHLMFKKFFYSTLISTILSAIVGITAAFTGFGVWALVIKELTGMVSEKVVLFFVTKWYPKLMFSWKRMKVLLKFSWKILVGGLIYTIGTEASGFIIGKKYSSKDLAFYNKGKSWPQIIGDSVDGTVRNVLFPILSKAQDEPAKVKRMMRRAIKTSGYVMFAAMMGLAAIAPMFVRVVLGDAWIESVPFVQIMCFVYAFLPVHSSNIEAIRAMGRSDISLIQDIIKRAVGIAALVATMWFGTIWIAAGVAFTTIISALVHAFPNKKLLNYSWIEQMKDILPYFGLVILMGAPVYAMNYLNLSLGWNIYLVLVLQVIVGIGLYIALSILFRLEIFKYLLNTIKEIFKKKKKTPAPATEIAPIEETAEINVEVEQNASTCEISEENNDDDYSSNVGEE